jgi:P27 family predicted phage terminase small subunit
MMGQRGPAPTPTEVLKRRGSWRAKKRKNEPKAATTTRPRCPNWLNVEARKEWQRLVVELEDMGVLAVTDRNALSRYCVLLVRWRAAEKVLRAEGTTFMGAGGPQARPETREARDLAAELGRIEREFGLTPSARTRVMVERGEEPAADDSTQYYLPGVG